MSPAEAVFDQFQSGFASRGVAGHLIHGIAQSTLRSYSEWPAYGRPRATVAGVSRCTCPLYEVTLAFATPASPQKAG